MNLQGIFYTTKSTTADCHTDRTQFSTLITFKILFFIEIILRKLRKHTSDLRLVMVGVTIFFVNQYVVVSVNLYWVHFLAVTIKIQF